MESRSVVSSQLSIVSCWIVAVIRRNVFLFPPRPTLAIAPVRLSALAIEDE